MCELLAHASTKCSNLPHEQIHVQSSRCSTQTPVTVQIRELSSARLLLSAAVAPSTHASSPAAAKRRLWIYTTAIEAWPADEGWRWLRWPRCSVIHRHGDGALPPSAMAPEAASSLIRLASVSPSQLPSCTTGPPPSFLLASPAPAFCRDSNEAGVQNAFSYLHHLCTYAQ